MLITIAVSNNIGCLNYDVCLSGGGRDEKNNKYRNNSWFDFACGLRS